MQNAPSTFLLYTIHGFSESHSNRKHNHQGTVLGRYDFCVAFYALSSTHISEQLSGIA